MNVDYTPTTTPDANPSATPSALASLLRSVLISIGGVLAAKGWASSETINEAIGIIMVVAPAAWGIWQKYEANKTLKAAIASPAVKS